MSLASLAALVLVAYVPGALFFRLPMLDPRARARLAAEERLFWAVLLSVGWSVMVTFALAAGGWYRFDRLLLINAALALVIGFATRGHLRLTAAPRPTWTAVVPAALLAGGLWLYGPPAEYIMGGKDPGTYVNEGIQIAQRGTLVTRDPAIATLPAEFRDLFVPPHNVPSYYGSRFMGFFVLDPAAGTVLGQFPHFFPASIAIGYGLDGLTGARRVPIAWALLGLLAVYFLGARLFGVAAAAAGTALLGLNVIQVWFSGYPNAEAVAQALLFAAMLAWSRAQVDGMPFFGPVAASLVGMLLFLRFDMVIAAGGFVGAAALGRVAGLAPVTGFIPILILWTAAAGVYLLGLMQPYMALPIVFIANLPWWQIVVLSLAAVLALALLAGAARLPVAKRLLPWLPATLATIAVAAATYAFFFRQTGGRIAEHDAMALRTFGWYITPAGIGLAVLGYVLAVRRLLTRDSILLLTVSLYAGFFFYKIRIVPDHYWMTRRFLPVILPGALLLIGYAAFGRWRHEEGALGRRVRLAIGMVAVAGLAVAFWAHSRPLLGHVEYAGLIPRLEKMAGQFGDRDLIIVESRDASDVHVLALPLAYIYAKQVLVLPNRRPDPIALAHFLRWAKTQYSAAYFIGGGGTELLSKDVAVEPVGTEVFQVPEWAQVRNALPEGPRRKEFDFSIYRFVDPPAAPTGRIALDLGVNDDVNVLRFHAKERHQNGTTFRWSRDVSYLSLQGVTADDRELIIVMDDGGRPPAVARATVEVSADDRVLGRVEVGSTFKAYTFAVPPDLAARAAAAATPLRVKLVTNTWRPKDALPVNDDRVLGVMVDRVEVK